MADGKNGMNRVARRSTRVFENDIDVRKNEDAVPDGGICYVRTCGREEKSQERDIRLGEMVVHTRTSSMSSLAPVDGEILTTFQKATRSDSEEVFSSVQGEVAEKPEMPGRPRNLGLFFPEFTGVVIQNRKIMSS